MDLETFKTQPCSQLTAHTSKSCPFYHNDNDRRRVKEPLNAICFFVQNKMPCPEGDECRFAHNLVELFYKKDNFKTKYCSFQLDRCKCPYGNPLFFTP